MAILDPDGSHSNGVRYEYVPDHEPSTWLRGRIDQLARRLIAGEMRVCCPHMTIPTLHALWRPDCLVCPPCRRLVAPEAAEPENTTCDRCRRRVPGLTLGLVETPGVIVVYGLCDDCQRREMAA